MRDERWESSLGEHVLRGREWRAKMCFVKLAIDRAMAETEDTRDKQHGALRAAEVATGAPRRRGSGGCGRINRQCRSHPHTHLWRQTQNGWIWVQKSSRYYCPYILSKGRRRFTYLGMGVAQERKLCALESHRHTSCLWNQPMGPSASHWSSLDLSPLCCEMGDNKYLPHTAVWKIK